VREALGMLGPTCLLTLAGLGVVVGSGMVRPTLGEALPALGLAYLAGVCAVMLVGIAVISAGASFDLPLFTAVCLMIGAGGFSVAARRAPTGKSPSRQGPQMGADPLARLIKPSLVILGLLIAGYLAVLLLAVAVQPMDAWDGWSLWTRKALLLADFQGVPTQFFAEPAYAFMHQDYPLLLPLLESIHIRAMGEADEAALHVIFWFLMVGFLGALAFLTWRVRSSGAWLSALLAAALVPWAPLQLGTGYADYPMAFLLGTGVLLLGLWLRSGEPSEIVLAALLLGGATSVKNEALPMMASAVLVAGVLLAGGREWARLTRLAVAAAVLVLAVLPWRLWVAVHDLHSDLPLAKGLTPGYLLDRLDRVWPSLKSLSWEFLKQGGWIVPVACLTIALALRNRPARRVALFYILTAAGAFGSVLWAFVITRDELQWQIDTAADRVVVGAVFVLAVGLAHLWSMAGPRPARASPPPDGGQRAALRGGRRVEEV
jgi:hypothetical protein